jgi:hypothetical protein
MDELQKLKLKRQEQFIKSQCAHGRTPRAQNAADLAFKTNIEAAEIPSEHSDARASDIVLKALDIKIRSLELQAELVAADGDAGTAPAQTATPATTMTDQTAAVKPAPLAPVVNDGADPCAVFRAMSNLVASDLTISFVGDKSESGLGANNMLEITAFEIKKRIPLGSLNLLDKRNGNLNSQCAILLGMARNERLPNTPANSKKMERLRSALRVNLGINDDPFEHFVKFKGWQPRFTLADNRGAADKRAKEKAEYRQPSIEGMNLLERYVAPDEPLGQEKDANERRRDFAADDWMRENSHSFSSDDLPHDK